MGLLQYTSKEMFSSTELIRKSKMVFDKLGNEEIEKAIILRDGKPSFMLLDFAKYENIIGEYLQLQEEVSKLKNELKENKKKEEPTSNKTEVLEEEGNENSSEISDDDLEAALAKIEKLDIKVTDTNELEELNKELEPKEKQPLKDFWE